MTMAEHGTLLALGAHADDCVFGLPGTMLQAVRQGYRVVVLNLIGDYRTDLAGRTNEAFTGQSIEIGRRHGVETRFLPFASGELDANPAVKKAVAGVVAELRPQLAFHLWPNDTHADHVAAAPICHSALQLAGRILKQPGVPQVRQRYSYDNGPCHTVGFVPNRFVDITPVWREAWTWVGEMGALYRHEAYDPTVTQPHQRSKEILAAYRGLTCGVDYAEAFHAAYQSCNDLSVPGSF
jgi:N-acetylglucosamine malate deacetylase 1